MTDPNKETPAPQTPEQQPNADPSGTGNPDPKKQENMVPKSRFDEVNTEKKAAEERAELYKTRYEESLKGTEEGKQQLETLQKEVLEKDRSVWKSKALRSITPQVADILEKTNASFTGESEEDYVNWAKQKESEIAGALKSDATDVDGNRSGDPSSGQMLTREQLAKLPLEERQKYLSKVLPRTDSD